MSMLINEIKVNLFVIDGEFIAKVTTSETNWLLLKPTEAGFKVTNMNKKSSYYVIVDDSPVSCGCEYNTFNPDDYCKHMLTVGKFLQKDATNIPVINSKP